MMKAGQRTRPGSPLKGVAKAQSRDTMQLTPEEIERRHSHPAVSRYDRRSTNGQLGQERHRERELRAIRKRIKSLIGNLEAADDGNIPAKRLYFEILDRERDRLEGKPFTRPEPPKAPSGESPLRQAIQDLFNPKPSTEDSPAS